MNLDILIKTEAELQGAKSVEQQLERDIGKAKALGIAYDELEKKLVRVRAAIANGTKGDGSAINDQINAAEKLADAKLREQRIRENNVADQAGYLSSLTKEAKELGETAQATDKATTVKGRLLDGLKKLGNQVPVVGYALNALKNPFTAIAVAALLTKKAIDDYVASVEEMADGVRAVDSLQGRVVRFFDIIAESKNRSNAFNESLKAIATQAGDANDKLRQLNDEIQRKNRLAAENEGARKNLALAQIEDDESTKKISPLEAAKRRVAVEVQFAAEAKAREDATEQAQQTGTLKAARQAAEAAAAAKAALPGAEAASDGEAKRLRELQGRVKAEKADLDAEEARLLKEEKALKDKLQPFGGGALGTAGRAASFMTRSVFETEKSERKRNQDKLDENVRRRSDIEATRVLRDADVLKQQGAVDAAEKKRKELEDASSLGSKSASDLNKKATEQAAAIDERRAAERRTGPIQDQANAINAGVEQRRIVEESAERLNQEAEKLLGELGVSNKVNLQVLQRIVAESQSLREELERIVNREGNRR